MTIKAGIVMDPINAITYEKDTTLAMLWAMQEKGWQLFYMEQQDLYQYQGKAMGAMAALTVYKNPKGWYHLEEQKECPLSTLDVICMRKDPPFNNEYIYSTYLLEQAENDGVLVVNKPQSLRDCNEKFFSTLFPQCIAPSIISCDMERLKRFIEDEGDVIVKPLDGMGGVSVFRVKEDDPNISVILETITAGGKETVMGQKFISAIDKGDKRILLINGKPVPYALARIPKKGETRGNLAAGGKGVGQKLSTRDLWIAEQVAPTLQKKGIIFAGLDVIGDYLTEINVTSPTCVRELNTFFDLDIARQLVDEIETKLKDH